MIKTNVGLIGNPRQTAAALGIPYVIASSGVASTPLTGTTDETAIATITLPGGCLGANGWCRIETIFSHTNSANNKTLRTRLGSISGTTYQLDTVTTTASTRSYRRFQNRNSQSSQVGGAHNTAASFTATAGSAATSSVDTSADFNIVISGQLTNTGESITLESYSIEIFYKA